jgi:hypothetical protein
MSKYLNTSIKIIITKIKNDGIEGKRFYIKYVFFIYISCIYIFTSKTKQETP